MSTQRAGAQQVNLVDPSLLRVPERLSRNTLLSVIGVGALLVSVHATVEQYQLGRQLSSASAGTVPVAAAVAVEASGVDGMAPHLLSMQEQIMRGETLRSALAQGGDLPDNAGGVVNAVIRALPDTMWLTELQVLGDKSVVISGGTLERPALAAFAKKLEANPTLTGTPIAIIQLEPRGGRQDTASSSGQAQPDHGEGQGEPTTEAVKAPTHFAFTLATRLQSSLPGGPR